MSRLAWTLPVAFVLIAGCQSSGGTAKPAPTVHAPDPTPTGGCLFAVQGGSDFAALLKGINQQTVTKGDVLADLSHIAGHLNDAETIATGALHRAAADGSLRARQMRVDFTSTGPTPHLAATTHKLSADFDTIHSICL